MATITGLSNGVDWSTIALVPSNFASRINDIDLRFDALEAAVFNTTPSSISDSQLKASVLGGTITIKGSGLLSSPTVTSVTWSRSGGDGFSLKGSLKYDGDGDLKSGKITSAMTKEDGEAITMTGSVTVQSSGFFSGTVKKLSWNDDGNTYTASGTFSVSGGLGLTTVSGTATGFTVKTAGGASLAITGVSMSLAELNSVTDVGDLLALLPAELTGNDTLSFTTNGTALLDGGAGNDLYIVSSPTQTVAEAADQGTDTVRITFNDDGGPATEIELADFANIENLEIGGKGAFSVVGTAGDNLLKGNAWSNEFTGGGGNDTMIGGREMDTYNVDGGDVVIEAADGGIDFVRSSVSFVLGPNVEHLTLTGSDPINGTGNGLRNVIQGNTGINTLTGGGGNDTYDLENTEDVVVELAGGGTDTVMTSASYTLPVNVERLILLSGGLVGTGNGVANRMTGSTGNDTLDGGAGNDTLIGGTGDDLYIVDRTGDVITELAGQGEDTVQSSVSYKLAAHVDNLELTGAALNGTGNGLDNEIEGNALDNKLNGSTGNDTLTGGAGNDLFIFSTARNALTNVDTITDFTVGQDRLALDNDIFTLLGGAGALAASRFASGAGLVQAASNARLIYDTTTGDLYYDSNGATAGGSVKIATLAGMPALTAADIIVLE